MKFYFVVHRNSKVHVSASSLFSWLLLGPVVLPRLRDPSVSQNSIGVCASCSPGQFLGCAYTICSYVLNLLHNSLWIILPTQSCLVLYDFCASLLLLLLFTHQSFSHQLTLMVFYWRLSDSKFPGVFSVFWPSSIMLSFGCSPLGRQLPKPPVLLNLLLFQFEVI